LLLAFTTPAAAAPRSLDDEVLSQHTPYFGPISGVCSTDQATGTTSYSLGFAGLANGPYPGTFTEQIQATIGPQTGGAQPMGPFPDGFDPGAQNPSQVLPVGQLLRLTASFSIDSANGSVRGTKALRAVVPADSTHAGVCREWMNEPVQGFGTVTGAYKDVRAFDLDYEATITTNEGSLRDEGATRLQARQGEASNQGGLIFDVNDLGQRFDSALQPELGRSVGAAVVRGRVFVGRQGRSARASQKGVSFVPLDEARTIPVGSFVDTRRGTVRLTSARDRAGRAQSGNFAAGVFQVLQSRQRKARGLTSLVLKGASFRRCQRSRRATASQRRLVRRLRANARGRFRTRGRHSAATVRGTAWTTSDRCDGTLTKVTRGRVVVRDFRRRRNVSLRAGRSYLARAP
jgi:hypothetical protein